MDKYIETLTEKVINSIADFTLDDQAYILRELISRLNTQVNNTLMDAYSLDLEENGFAATGVN